MPHVVPVSHVGPASGLLQLGPIDALVSVFGPFVFPVLLFALGVVGYLLLVALGRVGIEL